MGILFSYSQSTIAIQSFESSGSTWLPLNLSTPSCTVGTDVWDFTTSLPGIAPNDGNQFWGIRDLDGSCGGSGFESMTLPNINISSFSNVILSFDYNAIGFDNNEDLKYELFFDNVSQGEIIVVNGTAGNSDNTNGWLTETISIPSSVSQLSLVLSAKCNNNNDRAGFDNIILQESAILNDNCSSATSLIVGTNNTQNIITGTNIGATSSGQLPNPTCAKYQGNDIWYTAQVPTNGIITVETQNAGSSIDTAIEIYTGSCNNLTQIACHDDVSFPGNLNSKIDLAGLANATIYIRVWAWNNASSGDFNIVAYSTPPVINNDCIDAQTLIVGTTNTENVITGTNVGATDSGERPTPNCANYNGGDIWYTAQVPESGLLTIETLNAGSPIDTGIAAYTGSCGNLTQIDCDDDTGSNLYSVINITGLPNTTIYIRAWIWNNESSGDFNIVAYSPLCPFTTRWNNSGWNNGAPNSFTSAIINKDYDTATDGNFESCDCTINANTTLNVRANNYITINNDLTVQGNLEVRHEGSLLMTNDNGQVSVTGILNVHKTTTPFKKYDYNYWSSPIKDETVGDALATSPANYIYKFNTTNFIDVSPEDGHDDDFNDWEAVGDSAQMTPGVGYIAMGPISGTFPQTQSVIFNGEINNGVIQTPISLSGNDANNNDDYNFIGNPYPSAINVDLLLNNSLNTSTVNGTIYLWTHNTEINTNVGEYAYTADDYATYTSGTGGTAAVSSINKSVIPVSSIASGQGFFIEAIVNGSITFNNSMRISTDNNNFFRTPETKSSPIEKDRIWLNLSNDKGAFNQLLVGFIEGASNEIDRYDGLKLGGSYVSFYSIIDEEKFAVNGRGRLTEQEVISLGFSSKIDEGEMLKISIAHIEGRLNSPEFDILLKDNLLNTIHNLNEDDYEFIINEKGTFNNRFELIINTFSILDIEDESVNNDLIITNTENQMTVSINNSSVISSFKVYDILGKLIIDKTPNKDEVMINTQNISKGTVLIIKVTLDNSQVVSKKVILSR